jgi:hypothetical protein
MNLEQAMQTATINIGIRMIFSILKDVEYQNILGMNVLTMKI